MNEEIIFSSTPKRIDLLKLATSKIEKKIVIGVHRNHSFEMIENIISPFLNYSGISANLIYSDYDDSLNFHNNQDADIQLIWLDTARYKNNKISQWLYERILYLRSTVSSPIVLIHTGDKEIDDFSQEVKDFFVFSVSELLKNFSKEDLYDIEKEAFSGTKLSNKACIKLAQILGLSIIPSIIQPSLKAIVFDLDNTLYNGVLGEEGIDNIKVTKAHTQIQNKILELKNKGFFICLASKNEEADAIELFKARKDFVLKWNDFACTRVNWNPKSSNIREIAKQLNIGTDAILFIDDNPAEIQNVESSNINVKTFLARTPDLTLNALNLYPRLLKLKKSKEDSIRTKDVQANQIRNNLAKELSQKEYFEKLGIELTFSINDKSEIPRISELFGKTNQFIFTYARYSEQQVSMLMNSVNSAVITVKMSDNLSDSGIIAICAAKKDNENNLELLELTISCRALGRNLEDIMILKMFEYLKLHLKSNNKIKINYKKGPRNAPAIGSLEKILKTSLSNDKGFADFEINKTIDTSGLSIKIKYPNFANLV